MNWIQLHLALNHLPVVGVPMLIAVLAVGWWRKSPDILRLALWALFLLAVAAIAIKFTGDFAAEQSAERLSAQKLLVARHEQSGDQATTGVFLLAVSAALTIFLSRKGRPVRSWLLAITLVAGILTSVLYARTAHSGGQITHPELRVNP